MTNEILATTPQPADYPARYWHALGDGRLQCDLCPRECRLRDGQRGFCFVRQRRGDHLILTTYGRSSGFCIDPIEKKPLNHFFPGTSVLSFGTAGCNLGCKFCQNHEITTATRMDALADAATPADLVSAARAWRCHSIAFTYNDPVIFAEYAMDVAEACRDSGIETVAVTAGYLQKAARRDFFRHIDAANVDLKGFRDDFYRKLTGGRLATVLDTLTHLRAETDVWFEITTLLIPGHNDDAGELAAQCEWIVSELGPDTPVHFSAFHPDHRMSDIPPTPPRTLTRARDIALAAGLRHVYTGNVHDRAGDTTHCAGCGTELIVRDWYQIIDYRLTADGRCPICDRELPGRFGLAAGDFGPRRIPIRIH